MNILSRLRLRTKLTLLLGMSALAVVASIGLAASQLRDRMMTDRIGKLRATTEMVIGFAQGLEKQIVAGTLTRTAAVAQLADAVMAMHFDNGEGYVTFQTHDGLVLVHGLVPARNGKPAEGRANGVSINTVAWSMLEKSKEAVIFYVAVNPPLMVPTSKVAIAIRFDPWDTVAISAANTGDLDVEFRSTLMRLGTIGGVVLLVTMLLGWLVNRDIAGSLGALKAAMERLAHGDLSVAVPGTARRDEVGGMASAVLVFRDSMETAARLTAEQEEARTRADLEKQKALMSMADKIEAETSVALGQIGQRATALAETAGGMTASALRTGGISRDAAEAAGHALATAQTVASAAEQLAASIQEIGSQVGRSTTMVLQAVTASDETRATIGALNEQVGQIGQVADMIRDIASRTNLLALNATIEAARAGDAGKGFAVVASEVKQLATQTARSTEEITRRIGEIRSATGASVAAVARIEQSIAAISEVTSSIAAAVEEQGAATAEIARNVAETAAATGTMTSRTGEVSAEAVRTGEQAAGLDRDTAALVTAVGDLRQSVVRVVRTSTDEVDRRSSSRHVTDMPCRIAPAGGRALSATVIDLSTGGAQVTGGPAMRGGERGSLDIPGVGFPLPFQVRRMDAGILHISFELDAAAAARFQSIPARLARDRAA